jgi:tellurite resistance protein TerC
LNHPLYWVLFVAGILLLIAFDLLVLNRGTRRTSLKRAALNCAFWVSLAMAFNVYIYYWRGHKVALEFFTGYLIEESLSIDNIFVFVLIMSYFAVPETLQHRVLYWGLLDAIVMRGTLILVGSALISRFHWLLYVFGVFLLITGIRLFFHKDEEVHPEKNPVFNLFRRIFPMTKDYVGGRFFVRENGRLHATPLALVLVMIETTDLIFAFDSIPAIFGITRDPFIIYSSNIFAILGLRSLYFLLAGVIGLFRYLQLGLALVLVFIGGKMLVDHFINIPILISLGIVFCILATAILLSLRATAKEAKQASLQTGTEG